MRVLLAAASLAAIAHSAAGLACANTKTNTTGHGDRYLGTAPTNDAVNE
jgi:hypothetical protein